MKYFKQLLVIINVGLLFLAMIIMPVNAANANVNIKFDPSNANFTAGEKSVVYLMLEAPGDTISAAAVSVTITEGITITDMLSPVDSNNRPVTNTKLINKKISDNAASATILLVKNTADLPSLIKIPVVVVNGKGIAGKLKLDTHRSEIVNGAGKEYVLSSPSEATVSFSAVGQLKNPAPSPTPLPRNSMVLTISATLQGADASSAKKKTVENVKVQLVGKNGIKSVPAYMTFTPVNGKWQGKVLLSGVSTGSYQLLIKAPLHLQKKICVNTPSEKNMGKYACKRFDVKLTSGENQLDLTRITLMAGDVGIQDGILNAYDLSYLQNIIKKSSAASTNDGDVNYDRNVDAKDYDLIIQSMLNTSGLDQK